MSYYRGKWTNDPDTMGVVVDPPGPVSFHHIVHTRIDRHWYRADSKEIWKGGYLIHSFHLQHFHTAYQKMKEEGLTDREICQEIGMSKSNFYHIKRQVIDPGSSP